MTRSFDDAPELRGRNRSESQPDEQPMTVDAGAYLDARLENEQLREELEARDNAEYLDLLADDEPTPEALDEAFRVEGGAGQAFQALLDNLNARDPAGADNYLHGKQLEITAAKIQAENDEQRERLAAAQAKAQERLEAAVQRQSELHRRELENPVFHEALQLVEAATVERMTGSGVDAAELVPEVFARAKELVRAHTAAVREYQTRAAFAQPSFADAKAARQRTQPTPPSLEDVARRMPPQRDVRQARRVENVDNFREAFKAEMDRGRTFGEDMRKLAAKAEHKQAEVEVKARLSRGRR